MDCSGNLDKKAHLKELISLYKLQLKSKFLSDVGLHKTIKEELRKCQYELNLIKAVDIEGAMLANASAYRSLITS